MASPVITVIMLIGHPRLRAAWALASVLAQEGLEQAEIVIIDSAASEHPALPGSEHPQVRCFAAKEPANFGAMKAEGVHLATTELVVFVEDHVQVNPGWLKSILKAFEGPWGAVGTVVDNANPQVGMSAAVALVNYGLWAPPVVRGETRLLPGNNTAYRRQALLDFGQDLSNLLTTDTVLQWRLMAQGGRLFLEGDASIRHLNPTSLKNCLLAEYYYHWPFAAVRAESETWGLWRKVRYLILSPLIPWVRLWRSIRLNSHKRILTTAALVRWIPNLILILHAAVVGQIQGIIRGPRQGIELFTAFELNSPRPNAEE